MIKNTLYPMGQRKLGVCDTAALILSIYRRYIKICENWVKIKEGIVSRSVPYFYLILHPIFWVVHFQSSIVQSV